MSEIPEDKPGVPLWATFLVAAAMAFTVGQCTFATSKLSQMSADQFSLKMKLDRIEDKLSSIERMARQ